MMNNDEEKDDFMTSDFGTLQNVENDEVMMFDVEEKNDDHEIPSPRSSWGGKNSPIQSVTKKNWDLGKIEKLEENMRVRDELLNKATAKQLVSDEMSFEDATLLPLSHSLREYADSWDEFEITPIKEQDNNSSEKSDNTESNESEAYLKFQIAMLETRCDDLESKLLTAQKETRQKTVPVEASCDVSGLIEILEQYEREIALKDQRIAELESNLEVETTAKNQLRVKNDQIVNDLESCCFQLAQAKYELANIRSYEDDMTQLVEERAREMLQTQQEKQRLPFWKTAIFPN